MSSRRHGEHASTSKEPTEGSFSTRSDRRRAKRVEKAQKKAAREAKKAYAKGGVGVGASFDEQAYAASKERAANAEQEDLKDPGARGRWARARAARKARKKQSKHEERVTKPHKQSRITKGISDWWGRLLGAASDKTFAGQEEQYASHKTTRDYIWNTIGVGAWGGVFPLLTIVVTQLTDVEIAGMFSLAFVTGMLLMYIGNYGVRTYQVSDINETHSFSDYQVNRYLTCAIMILVGIGYCTLRGYGALMFTMSIGVYVYKMVDALADVYEGRLQQYDKMYLAGISQTFRSVAVFLIFTIVLAISRDVGIASIAMAVTAVVTFLLLTLPLALFETPKSERFTLAGVGDLFKQCFPLFLALFLYALIDNMPKFVMEGVLSYDNQLYFNALYFPAQAILLTVGVIYKPLLLRLANLWADPKGRRKFDLAIFAMVGIAVAITVVLALFMRWIGIDIMSFLYGLDFKPYEGLCYIMLAAGAVTAIIDFLYQAITVLRRQRAVMKLYIVTFGFSLFVPTLLISFTGLPGAVIGYLIVMSILLVLLVMEYVSIRLEFKYAEANGTPIEPIAPAGGATSEPSVNVETRLSENAGSRPSGSMESRFSGNVEPRPSGNPTPRPSVASSRSSRKAHARAATREAFDRGKREEQSRRQQPKRRYAQGSPSGNATNASGRMTSSSVPTVTPSGRGSAANPSARVSKSRMSLVQSAPLVNGREASVHMKQQAASQQRAARSEQEYGRRSSDADRYVADAGGYAAPEGWQGSTVDPSQSRYQGSKIPKVDLQELQRREVDGSQRAHANERRSDDGANGNRR